MAKAKFNYRPVYFICGILSLIVVLAMVVPDPTNNPSNAPVEQRNLLVVFNEGVSQKRQWEIIKRGQAIVYIDRGPQSFEVMLEPYRELDAAFNYFDNHDDVARASKGAVLHRIMLHRDLMPEFKR